MRQREKSKKKKCKTPEVPEQRCSSLPSSQSTTPLQNLYDSIHLPSDMHLISPVLHDESLLPGMCGTREMSGIFLVLIKLAEKN